MKLTILLALIISTSAAADGVGPVKTECSMMRGEKRSNPKAGISFQDTKLKVSLKSSSATGQ